MFRWSVLLLALLINAPTVWAALADQTVDVNSAMIHFLVTVPVVALLLGLVRSATGPAKAPARSGRRKSTGDDSGPAA